LGVFAGDRTTVFEGADRAARQRGHAVVLVKPDDTVLVRDAAGYRPVAWLTRSGALTVERPGDSPTTVPDADGGEHGESTAAASPAAVRPVARDDDRRLRVAVSSPADGARYPVGEAGVPVADGYGRRRGAVIALDGGERYPLPTGASALDTCYDCRAPRIRAERGVVAEIRVDRSCEPPTRSSARPWTASSTVRTARAPSGCSGAGGSCSALTRSRTARRRSPSRTASWTGGVAVDYPPSPPATWGAGGVWTRPGIGPAPRRPPRSPPNEGPTGPQSL